MRKITEDTEPKEIEILRADDWQLNLLRLNPEYVWWGNYEDYMSDKDSGWRSPLELSAWSEHWELDELNELVNFYFTVSRKNHECPKCEGTNLNPETKQISDDWYDFAGTGRRWSNNISAVEVEALIRAGRLSDLMPYWTRFDEETNQWMHLKDREKGWEAIEPPEFPTPEKVNQWSRRGIGHDSINHWIATRARAEFLGVYGHCDNCEKGYIYDEPKAHVSLQLWYLLPRKGASRGVYIKNIEQSELPEVFAYLNQAKERNNQRFAKIPV